MTSTILTDMFRTFDELKLFDRSEGKIPFFLLDGHGTRLETEFLEYVNNPDHQWCVCLGVPYGTSLWQIGDSKEQNGSFNIASSKAKIALLKMKDEKAMLPVINPFEAIIIIKKAWYESFGRVETNKKAIAERGWFPYNRNLLTYPDIRSTMTEVEKAAESEKNIILPSHHFVEDLTMPTLDEKYLPIKPGMKEEKLNFATGTAMKCLDAIVQHNDIMEARARNKEQQDEGKSLKEKLQEAKRITVGM